MIIKQFSKWAARNRYISGNPLEHISLVEPAPTVQPCYTAEQVAALIDAADGHLRPVLVCLAYTGMRIGEVRDLLWEDVTLGTPENQCILVRRGGSGAKTKTGKVRRIPVHPALCAELAALPRKSATVFTRAPSTRDPKGVKPINVRKVLTQVKRLCKQLKFLGHERMKVHSFRHFFCSTLAKEGAPERYVRGLLGHSSSDMVNLYFTMYDPMARSVIGKIQLPPSSSGESDGPAAA